MRHFTLYCIARDSIVLELYEIELATSPCLYSLTRGYDFPGGPCEDQNQAAIMDMLAGASPNLQEINMFWRDDEAHSLTQPRQKTRNRYQPGSLPGSSPSRLGRLRRLNLVARDPSSVIRQWSSITDFQCLESLEVTYDPLFGDALFWLASCRFPALKHLSFGVDFEESDTDTPEAANIFIRSLDSLNSLKLRGPFDLFTLLPTVDHCGHRLRRLLLASPKLHPRAESLANADFILVL